MPQAFAEAEAMAAYLKEKGIDAPCDSLYNEALRNRVKKGEFDMLITVCLLYTSPSPRDRTRSRMPSSA